MGERQFVLDAFERVIGSTHVATLDALLPHRPWAEAIPSSVWRSREMVDRMDARRRHALYLRLVDVLGDEAADATMRFLPPVPWRALDQAGLSHLLD